MSRVKQASKQKRTTKAAAVKVLGAAGLSFSLVGGASASTVPTASIPQSDNTSPNQRFVLSEEEMVDVSLATFYVFDREHVGSGVRLARGGCGGYGAAMAAGAAVAAMVAAGSAVAAMVAAGLLAAEVAVVARLLAAEVAVVARLLAPEVAVVPRLLAPGVAVVARLLASEVAVASAVAVASVVAVAAAAGSASGSMTTSVAGGGGTVTWGTVTWGTVAAAHPGERAACAKSHDLTAGLTRHSAKLRSASRWLRV